MGRRHGDSGLFPLAVELTGFLSLSHCIFQKSVMSTRCVSDQKKATNLLRLCAMVTYKVAGVSAAWGRQSGWLIASTAVNRIVAVYGEVVTF